MLRNPAWEEEELAFALDLYIRSKGKPKAWLRPEATLVSQTLRSLSIHPAAKRTDTFRHPPGVERRTRWFAQKENGETPPARYIAVWDRFAHDHAALRKELERILAEHSGESPDDKTERSIKARGDITKTEKAQLIKARRGQGRFRQRVADIETECRLTGVTSLEHLRASHIKPWAVSSDAEKLDGHNGLLLAPHVDHLFDGGYISFADDGELLVSPVLKPSVLSAWAIDRKRNAGAFSAEQRGYLEYHRVYRFISNSSDDD